MDAIQFLEQDHRNAKKAMELVSQSPDSKKRALFDGLKRELEMHDRIEEGIFYPAVKGNSKAAGLQEQDKAAHESVEKTLAELSLLSVEDSSWNLRFSAMQKELLAHVSDEESSFFIKVRGILSAAELKDLGQKMAAFKERQLKAA